MTDEERAKLRARLNERENGNTPVQPVRSVHPVMEQPMVQQPAVSQTSYGESGVPFGITSMVLGIIALLLLFISLSMSAIVAAIIGIVMAGMAVTRGYDGGMQKAGKIMSWITLILVILVLVGTMVLGLSFSKMLNNWSNSYNTTNSVQQEQQELPQQVEEDANNPAIWNRTNMIMFSR